MPKSSLTAALIICLASCLALAAQPAPADKGVISEEGSLGNQNAENTDSKSAENHASESDADLKSLKREIADLQSEIQTLTAMLQKVGDAKKELEQLKAELVILEEENGTLSKRVKDLEDEKTRISDRLQRMEGNNATLEERLAKMETDGPVEQTTAKPAFVKSAVRFFNHENHSVKMNVNGVWHTVEAGENTVWVPYAPVHIYRYTDSEPRTFWKWKPHMDGYVMDFDIGASTE